jgi:uncharacterized protein (TIGR03437 family)
MKYSFAASSLAIGIVFVATPPPLLADAGVWLKTVLSTQLYVWLENLEKNGQPVTKAVPMLPNMATVPFADARSIQPLPVSSTTFVRQADGAYVTLQFALTAPYSPLSPMSLGAQLVSGGVKNLFGAPAGPAGTGLQSQTCAVSALGNDGSEVVACASNNSVAASRAPSGLPPAMLSYPIGQDVNSVFFADFNGDGNPDLAVAYDGSGGPGGIAILLNNGDGTFKNPVTYASGTMATNFAVLDLNHDGFLDIATVSLDNKVTVLLGNGDGTFGAAKAYAVGGGSGQAIAIADFNGDGNPDIAVGGTTGILLGNGDGTFRAGSPLPVGASGGLISAFAAGDLNGDGKVDLVYADSENQVVVPLFGNGDGTFQPGQAYAVSQLPSSLVLADYNNDGRLDIVNGSGDARIFGPSLNSNNTDILLNNGDGTFQGAPTYFTLPNSEASGSFTLLNGMVVANFGGTSPGVLASGGGLTLFIGNGKGGFQAPQSFAIQGDAGGIAAADFNGDGMPDAAVLTGFGNVAILLGTATGFGTPLNLASGVVNPSAIVAGDFSGDGNADLAVVGQTNGTGPGTLAILMGDGHGNFQAPVTIPAGVTPTALAAVDLNGDGKLDLVFSDSGPNGSGPGGGVYVALNNGAGVFQAPVQVFSGVAPTFGVGDVNGDGKLDLVVSSAVAGTDNAVLSWLAGNGNGKFQAPVVITTSNFTDNAILVQDFNGDGIPDIVLAHQGAYTSFLAGYGGGTFSAETPFLSTGQPTLLATADFNADGKPDLLVGGLTMSVLLNNSVKTAQVSVASAAPAISTSVAPGSLASAYGTDLANKAAGSASLPLPTSFGGTSISIQDASGNVTAAPLLYVIPSQVNFEVPPGLAFGPAIATITSGDGTQSAASLQVASVAPGIFELNSGGLAAAYVILYHADNTQTVEQVYTVSGGAVVATPVSLGSSTDKPYLFIFGTGLQDAGTAGVTVTVGGVNVPVSYAGAQGGFVGLDQVNAQLPASLAGKGNVTVQVTANGIAANAVNFTIQ